MLINKTKIINTDMIFVKMYQLLKVRYLNLASRCFLIQALQPVYLSLLGTLAIVQPLRMMQRQGNYTFSKLQLDSRHSLSMLILSLCRFLQFILEMCSNPYLFMPSFSISKNVAKFFQFPFFSHLQPTLVMKFSYKSKWLSESHLDLINHLQPLSSIMQLESSIFYSLQGAFTKYLHPPPLRKFFLILSSTILGQLASDSHLHPSSLIILVAILSLLRFGHFELDSLSHPESSINVFLSCKSYS